MALLRFRLAYIIVAVLRSTALRRVVDGSLDHHLDRHGETSSSLHPVVNTVRPHPLGSGRSVLTTGPHRLLMSTRAPHPLVRRGQKTLIRTWVRGVDKPFHIIAGSATFATANQGIASRPFVPRVRPVCVARFLVANRRLESGATTDEGDGTTLRPDCPMW